MHTLKHATEYPVFSQIFMYTVYYITQLNTLPCCLFLIFKKINYFTEDLSKHRVPSIPAPAQHTASLQCSALEQCAHSNCGVHRTSPDPSTQFRLHPHCYTPAGFVRQMKNGMHGTLSSQRPLGSAQINKVKSRRGYDVSQFNCNCLGYLVSMSLAKILR